MISFVFLSLGIGFVLTGLYFLRSEKKPDHYVWVGEGKDPFKN